MIHKEDGRVEKLRESSETKRGRVNLVGEKNEHGREVRGTPFFFVCLVADVANSKFYAG